MKDDTLHIISDDGGCCDKCHEYKKTIYISMVTQLCPECYIEKQVPTINFTERLDCAWLWSKENQCIDSVDLATLISCGWFMSEKVVDESEKPPKAIYKLKYYGKIACPRCVGVQFSDSTMKCPNSTCRATVVRGRAIQADFMDDT